MDDGEEGGEGILGNAFLERGRVELCFGCHVSLVGDAVRGELS